MPRQRTAGPEQIEAVKKWIAAGATFDGAKPTDPLHLVALQQPILIARKLLDTYPCNCTSIHTRWYSSRFERLPRIALLGIQVTARSLVASRTSANASMQSRSVLMHRE